MVVSLKPDLRFPIPGQQGHGDRIIQMVPLKESPGCFHVRILSSIISIQGRKEDENYAIYTTIGRAEGQADGLAHIPGKL